MICMGTFMEVVHGTKQKGSCNGFVLKCNTCGKVGCTNSKCGNHAFDGARCNSCGSSKSVSPR